MNSSPPMKPLEFAKLTPNESVARSAEYAQTLHGRRSVRHFSSEPVPLAALRNAVSAASSAPSGANKQPWTFALVTSPKVKRKIREAAEEEERAFYGGRAPDTWLNDLHPFGTDANKPFLEEAPALIAIFAHSQHPDGGKNYYVKESVGIAVGMLLSALHISGFATLTHTPSPMGFLQKVLDRPAHEKAYLLIPVGYPAEDCQVPDIQRKSLSEVLVEVS